MSRTAGLIVLVMAVVLLLTLPVNSVSSGEKDGCCPCPASGGKAGGDAEAANMENAPDTIELDMKGEFYGPTEFTHLDHTDYADDGCTQCHHGQPAGESFKKCGACHKSKPFLGPDEMNVPGLKGAYHRQCVGCHVEYGSGPTECTDCHDPKAGDDDPDDDGDDE